MGSIISTSLSSASRSVPAKRTHPLDGASSGISASTTIESPLTDHVEPNRQRKLRWQNTPGIQVSLQNHEPQLDEYRLLRSDGRRKDSTKVAPETVRAENTNRTIEAEQFDKRSVNPRSKIILDNFIQQMGGAEQLLTRGSYINTSI